MVVHCGLIWIFTIIIEMKLFHEFVGRLIIYFLVCDLLDLGVESAKGQTFNVKEVISMLRKSFQCYLERA